MYESKIGTPKNGWWTIVSQWRPQIRALQIPNAVANGFISRDTELCPVGHSGTRFICRRSWPPRLQQTCRSSRIWLRMPYMCIYICIYFGSCSWSPQKNISATKGQAIPWVKQMSRWNCCLQPPSDGRVKLLIYS